MNRRELLAAAAGAVAAPLAPACHRVERNPADKQVVAVADGLAASAAYWIVSLPSREKEWLESRSFRVQMTVTVGPGVSRDEVIAAISARSPRSAWLD